MLMHSVTYASSLPAIERVTVKDIKAASDFSSHDAEVIKKSVNIDVDENYHETLTAYLAIKINSSNAVSDYSQITISYDSFYEEVELLFANTIDENGNRQALDPDALQVQTPPSPYFFQDRRNIVFSVSALKAGTVIEYQYQKKTTQLRIPNYWSSKYFFYYWQTVSDTRSFRIDPVRHSEYNVSIPKSLDAKLSHYHGSKKYKTKQKTSNGSQFFSFKASNLAPIQLQSGLPAIQEFIPHIKLSTLDDWSEIKQWAGGLFEKERIITDEIKQIAQTINANSDTEQGLIKGVYQYLNNNIRYIYSHVGRGGYTPHNPSHTLNQGFGDCKDQTMLAVVLLNELGIEAYPALVNTETSIRFKPENLDPSFDHMLVYLPTQPVGHRWMDTTSDKAFFPGSLSYMSERPALILNDQQELTFVYGAKQAPHKNALNIEVTFDRLEDKKLLGTIKMLPTGSFEAYYRAVANQYNEEEERSFFSALTKTIYTNAQTTGIIVENNEKLFEPTTVTLSFEIDDVWELAPTPFSFSLSYQSIWRDIFFSSGLLRPQDRKVPMYFSENYGMNITLKTTIPEKDYYLKTVSSGFDVDNKFFKVQHLMNQSDVGAEISVQGEFYKSWVNLDDYDVFFNTYNDWLKSPYWLASYIQDTTRSQESALLSQSDESIEATNDLIQLHLDEGQFEKALNVANTAIARSDVNGKTYYLLGLSQAFNNEADASEASFLKAQELGYE